MSIATFTKGGTKAAVAAKLDKAVFGADVTDHTLLQQAYVAHLANKRSAGAKTKKRGEVSGGGIKPWRQKGTGRARVGSIRSPIWRGGGITFGPTGDQNYTHALSPRSKRQAVRQALSLAAGRDAVVVLEELDAKIATTKQAAGLLAKLNATGNVLVIVDKKEASLDLAVRNLPGVKVITATYVSTYDVLNADKIVLVAAAAKPLAEWLTKDVKGGAK